MISRPFLENVYLNSKTAGAFGQPDGARAPLEDYVEPSDLPSSGSVTADGLKARVIAGRKGSGKTMHIRRIKAGLHDGKARGTVPDIALTIDAEQTQLIGTRQVTSVATVVSGGTVARPRQDPYAERELTNHVIEIARIYPDDLLTETWQILWGRAILLSVTSHLVLDSRFSAYVDPDDIRHLERDFPEVYSLFRRDPRSPFVTLKDLIYRAKLDSNQIALSRARLDSLLDNPMWDDLEARLARILRETPIVRVIIDAVDEEFAHAPMEWLRCQKGLFYETMRFLRHSVLGARLHILISVRDLVLHSVFKSEHSPRYLGDYHIHVLHWDHSSARGFLDLCCRRLDRKYWRDGRRPTGFADWLGLTSVSADGGPTDIYDYVLNVTQCLPRELIMLGNFIAFDLEKGFTHAEALMNATTSIAQISALTQLEISANQARADAATEGGIRRDNELTGEYALRRSEEILRLLQKINTPIFSHATREAIRIEGQVKFHAPDLATVLWQNGLLAYIDDASNPIYFSLDGRGRLALPEAPAYMLHPSLRLLMNGLQNTHLGPV